MLIESPANPRIKETLKLRDRRPRDQKGLFLIEGYRELSRALKGGVVIEELYFCPEFFLGDDEASIIRASVRQYQCSKRVFEKLSYRDRPDGLLGVAEIKRKGPEELEKAIKGSKNPFFVVAESIEKPGNLGTILRAADGAGVDGVVVCDQCTDLYNPNTVRASVGTLFTVPVFEMSSKEAKALFTLYGVQVVAGTPEADKVYTEQSMKQPVAIAVGTEQLGLSGEWMKEAEIKVKIPQAGTADSLNVAMATALLLYEVVRQRSSS